MCRPGRHVTALTSGPAHNLWAPLLRRPRLLPARPATLPRAAGRLATRTPQADIPVSPRPWGGVQQHPRATRARARTRGADAHEPANQ